jgi:predicted adenylyl cyclase CyaB
MIGSSPAQARSVASVLMARNIEIKAPIESLAEVAARAVAVADEGPIEIPQDDTFFHCETGRLKLRVGADSGGELIFYQRTNQLEPKESFYLRSAVSAPDALREILTLAYGQLGRVRKRRTLFLVGRTRVHLDRVETLGEFLELEVVLAEGEPPQAGIREAENLMKQLGISRSQLIAPAYIDLLLQRSSKK